MSVAQDRLNYITRESVNLTKNATLTSVARDTGIPYSTLQKTRQGLIDLPEKYKSTLSDYYTKTSYNYLRMTGLSSRETNRFKGGSVERVTQITKSIYDALEYYANGTTIAKASKLGYLPSKQEINKLYAQSIKAIQEGLTKSRQSVEDWIQYGS